jgi:glycosyltransferase involved in cell wall biosynthesis
MQKKKIKLSIALAVKNEEKNLELCIRSIVDIADEIVVVDGGSTDRTVDIARQYGASVIETDNPPIFHINKQKALDMCHGEWILQLDADEVVTETLKKEILEVISDGLNGYALPRKNFFLGHWLRKGGQYPDYVIRLVKKGKAYFPCKSVHEQIAVEGKVGYLKEPLLHYSYKNISEYWRKADAYTTLTARELLDKRISTGLIQWGTYMVVKPIQTFFSLYIRHKGFIDRINGLLFAFFSALHYPIAYLKLKKLRTFQKHRLARQYEE